MCVYIYQVFMKTYVIYEYLRFDAVSRCHDVLAIYKRASANVDGFLRIFLKNSRLPWVFSEFTVTVHIGRSLNSSVDALRVPDTTLTFVSSLRA